MSKRFSAFLFMAFAAPFAFNSQYGETASGNAKAKLKVIKALTVVSTRDLNFGEAERSDWSGFVSPWDDTLSAIFHVTGEIGRAINVTVPGNGTVKMLVNGGNENEPNDVIEVNDFNFAGSTILYGGETDIYIGATHAPILATQSDGDYTGTFTVSVVY